MLRAVDPNAVHCKICGRPSPLFGVVDFHKSCLEAQGKRLNLSGKPIYYRCCGACGFLFTDAFDDWSPEAFVKHIYNDDYSVVDPDYAAAGPASNARIIAQTFSFSKHSLSVLDYGGGNGLLARALAEEGFQATTYDPLTAFALRPQGRFDLITCFEVMEHLPFPGRTVTDIGWLLADEGILLFSTLRNWQISTGWVCAGGTWACATVTCRCTRRSLAILFENHGMGLISISDLVHMAFPKLPPFASHLADANRS